MTGSSEPKEGCVMRENNRWVLAATSVGVMLMVVGAVSAEPTSDSWVQGYGRQDKDCLEWSDSCVNCLRAQSGGDYSCSNIGIACQPKEVRCIKRVDERTK